MYKYTKSMLYSTYLVSLFHSKSFPREDGINHDMDFAGRVPQGETLSLVALDMF